VQCSGLMRT